MPCKFDPKDLKDGDTLWSFGYGSNMDVESVQEKKLIKITGRWVDQSISQSINQSQSATTRARTSPPAPRTREHPGRPRRLQALVQHPRDALGGAGLREREDVQGQRGSRSRLPHDGGRHEEAGQPGYRTIHGGAANNNYKTTWPRATIAWLSQEPYDKHYVTLKAYDGRELNGFVYVKENDKENSTPSGELDVDREERKHNKKNIYV